jgi:toxin CcdB
MIRQFDVVPNPIRLERVRRPYIINVQHDHFGQSGNYVFASLTVPDATTPIPRLNPVLRVGDQQLFLLPNDLFTLPGRQITQAVANLEVDRDRIIAALDLVFTGV